MSQGFVLCFGLPLFFRFFGARHGGLERGVPRPAGLGDRHPRGAAALLAALPQRAARRRNPALRGAHAGPRAIARLVPVWVEDPADLAYGRKLVGSTGLPCQLGSFDVTTIHNEN